MEILIFGNACKRAGRGIFKVVPSVCGDAFKRLHFCVVL